MWIEILFVAAILWYWFSEGLTEGYTWAHGSRDEDRRRRCRTNKLITGHHGDDGVGVWGYHMWRMLGENGGIAGALIMTALIFYLETTTLWQYGLLLLGSWMIGYFAYERALCYVYRGNAWASRDRYHFWKFSIKRSNLFDDIVLMVGMALVAVGIL